MQTKLATWSQDPEWRSNDLYNLLYDRDWLHHAYGSVKSNSGARTAGVDGQTIQDFEEDLGENLESLAKELKSQSFDPKPVRRTYIPKGDDEERPLGIPTIKDRIVQEALRMVLEPIWESDFSEYSFGFRPNRRTQDAIQAAYLAISPTSKMQWVIDADVKGFFDNVDHGILCETIQDRITDRKMLHLIWNFLKSGVMEDGIFRHSTLGTPQGGIVSPVLANIYLNELDQWAKQWTNLDRTKVRRRRRNGKGNWRYIRYADDFLFLTNGTKDRAERMQNRIGNFVTEELNLELSEKKTEIVHASDGFEFLGYRLEMNKDLGVDRLIPKEAKQDIKHKVKKATSGQEDISVRRKFMAISSTVRGWANYYKYATNASTTFNNLDHYVWERITKWLAQKYRTTIADVCSNKLDNHCPVEMNEATITRVSGTWDTYTESCTGKKHPYLNGSTRERESLPEEDPWLATAEHREGWYDARKEALERDNWMCQDCGKDLEGTEPQVHHIRPRNGYNNPSEADRLDNLKTLCQSCHREIESNR